MTVHKVSFFLFGVICYCYLLVLMSLQILILTCTRWAKKNCPLYFFGRHCIFCLFLFSVA